MRLLPLVLATCTLAVPAVAGESRTLSGFTRVELAAPVDVEVRPGAFQVTLEMDSNVAQHLTTQVEDDTLRISLDGRNLNVNGKPRIKIRMPAFRSLRIQGSGDADIAGFKSQEKVALQISGSGDIRYAGTAPGVAVAIEGSGDVLLAEGEAGSLQATIQGSGNLKARDFKAKNVSVAIEGSGDADIRVAGGALSLAVNGSGDIRWTGEASTVSAATHGSGSIAKR
ncbi:MAG TPA: head GIN domain-containing protein [Myxococcaceae bacterium]|nr:head GIN domain-containing protein [Myxococcaceae bacterium]